MIRYQLVIFTAAAFMFWLVGGAGYIWPAVFECRSSCLTAPGNPYTRGLAEQPRK